MFIPPFNAILKALGTTRDGIKEKKEITVPVDFLKLLLGIAIKNGDFNEQGYLRLNPDVADAIKAGSMRSAREHYLAYGYFESRPGAAASIDEQWYRETYPDVADAILTGKLKSAEHHYLQGGDAEFRAPNPDSFDDCKAWKAALIKAKPTAVGSSLSSVDLPPPVQILRGERSVQQKEEPKSRGFFGRGKR